MAERRYERLHSATYIASGCLDMPFALDPGQVILTNASPGETGTPVPAASLGPESGVYVRRGQTAMIDLPAAPDGAARVRLEVGLGGVEQLTIDGMLSSADYDRPVQAVGHDPEGKR